MSRDRATTLLPRAVTPRDAALAAAVAKLRAEHPEWAWATAIGDEVAAQATEVAELRTDLETRRGAIRKLKGWVAGGWVAASLALGGGLIDYGMRRGRSDAAAEVAADARRQLLESGVANQRQDIEISVLRALVTRLERATRDGDQ